MSRAQLEFYNGLERQLFRGNCPDLQGQTDYLFFYAYELARNAANKGFKFTLYALLDLAELYHWVDDLADTCKRWAFDCLLALEEYEEFLDLSEPVEPFGTDTHRSNLRLNVQHRLGRDGLGVDLFRMAGSSVTNSTRQHPGLFRDFLNRCFAEDSETHGPWLARIISKLNVSEPEYVCDMFSGVEMPNGRSAGGIKIYCFYAAYDFNSRTKRFTYDFNDVIRDCGRKAENLFREQLGLPRIGEGWVSETALYHALRDAFSETDVVQHGRPHWLGRQHFDIWFPLWKIAVEHHGAQHFEPVEFFGGLHAFGKTQERDRRKAIVALKHGVELIVVTPEMHYEGIIDLIRGLRST